MTGALALVAALSISSQIQTHPAGLDSIGPSRARSLRTAPIIDKLYQQANKPALDFNFARFKDLHDDATGATSLVTFSRSAAQSPGTYVGADGLIHDAAVNLALYSEQFDSTYWTKSSGASVLANQAIAPDGKQTADLISVPAGNAGVYRPFTVTNNATYTWSVYVNGIAGETINVGVNSSLTPSYKQVVLTGNWQRVSGTITTVSTSLNFHFRSDFPTPDGVVGAFDVYAWGAQLEETDPATMEPTAYIKTTSQALAAPRFDHTPTTGNLTTNLLTYSEMLDNAVWYYDASSAFVTRTPNQATSPDGTTTADKIVLSSGRRADNAYIGNSNAGLVSAAPFNASVYMKDAGYRYGVITVGSFASGYYAIFDLQNGTVATNPTASGVTASIVDAGNGWYRCAVIADASVGGASIEALVLSSSPDNTLTTTHNGADGIFVWGAQFEAISSPTAGTYVRTLGETRSISDAVAPSLGLLVEEQRANLAPYSQDPSSWAVTGSVTKTANATSGPLQNSGGWKLESSGTIPNFYVDKPNPAAASVVAWAVVKKGSAATEANEFRIRDDTAAIDKLRFEIDWDTNAITYVLGSSGVTVEDVGNGWVKIIAIVSWTSGNSLRFNIGFSSSPVAVGEYFYFSHVQIEEGTFPTSYIPTEGSSQTRYADIAAVQDEDFATTNLLAYSESFDVGWSTTRLRPVVPNAATAPDGTLTADYIEQEAGQTNAGAVLTSRLYTGQQIISVYAKAAEKNFLRVTDNITNIAWFDLQNGTVGTVTGTKPASIEDVGNGWYRCSVSTTHTGTANLLFYLAEADNSATVTDSGGIYLWGASLTATEYPVEYRTTRNLLTDSQDFERSTWAKRVTPPTVVTYDATQAPDGTTTAVEISANYLTRTEQVIAGASYTTSAYIKNNNVSTIRFYSQIEGGGSFLSFVIDTSTWSVTSNTFSNTPTIVDIGNDWKRVSIVETAASSGSFQCSYWQNDNAYPGSGSFYLWGAQLEPGTTATDYVRTVDVVGKNYGWYEPTEGTVFVNYANSLQTTNRRYSQLDDGTGSNKIQFGKAGTNNTAIVSGGSVQSLQTFAAADDALTSIGFTYNDVNSASNGILQTPDTVAIIPIVSRMKIGSSETGAEVINGHIRRLTYWPVRQSDSTLQVITQ